jgi:hypothetical protein
MAIFKTSMEFMRRIYDGGLRQFEAPKPISTDVLCDELRIEFHRHGTSYKIMKNGLVVGEMETSGSMLPGDTLSLTGLKLYWEIGLQPSGRDE